MEQNETGNKIMYYSPMSNCIPQETMIKDLRLAMAYVPFQKFCTLLAPVEGLKRGTAFPELYSPYEGEDKKYNSYAIGKGGENL